MWLYSANFFSHKPINMIGPENTGQFNIKILSKMICIAGNFLTALTLRDAVEGKFYTLYSHVC